MVRGYRHVTVGKTTASLAPEQDFTSSVLRARDYMQQRYGDTEEAAEKTRLFCLMQNYVAEHATELNRGSLAVFGADQGLVSEHLLHAVHDFFTRQSVTAMKSDPPVSEVIELAETYASRGDTKHLTRRCSEPLAAPRSSFR